MSEQGCIAIVDDSEVILARVRQHLAREGYEVITSASGLGLAGRLASVDLVIIDFHMPGLDGGEVLEALKRTVMRTPAPLFYLYTSDRDAAQGHGKLGFDGAFIRKGEDAALAPQVAAVFRTIKMRKLAQKMRDERKR